MFLSLASCIFSFLVLLAVRQAHNVVVPTDEAYARLKSTTRHAKSRLNVWKRNENEKYRNFTAISLIVLVSLLLFFRPSWRAITRTQALGRAHMESIHRWHSLRLLRASEKKMWSTVKIYRAPLLLIDRCDFLPHWKVIESKQFISLNSLHRR